MGKAFYFTLLSILGIGLILNASSPQLAVVYLLILNAYVWAFLFSQKKQKDEFAPYTIAITPNLNRIAEDYKLYRKGASWDDVSKEAEKLVESTGDYPGEINFTVLRDEPARLVYHSDYNSGSNGFFKTNADRNYPLLYSAFRWKGIVGEFHPSLYVRQGVDGYSIGVTTKESEEKTVLVGDDNDLVELIKIPYSLAQDDLRKAAWKEDKGTRSFREDVMFYVPDQYNSKYFKLQIAYI